MPLPRQLNCKEAFKVVLEFFNGVSVKELARHFGVSRLTVARLIDRKTYKDCTDINTMVTAVGKTEWIMKVNDQMLKNRHNGRGNCKKVES